MRRFVPAFVAGFLLAACAAAGAQQYPPSSGELTTDTASAEPGDPVTVSGDGYAPGSTVTMTFESTPVVVGTAVADAAGRFTTVIRIPLDAAPGLHLIRASGVDPGRRPRILTAEITVRAQTASQTGAPVHQTATPASKEPGRLLSLTGAMLTIPLLFVAVGLVVLGGVLVARSRASG